MVGGRNEEMPDLRSPEMTSHSPKAQSSFDFDEDFNLNLNLLKF